MGIIAHCLVKNESGFIWFAINSVINYVDQMLVWDNGSSDATVRIIKQIKSSKIKFKDVSELQPEIARQKMLEESKGFDWIFVLDGDEVWPDQAIKNLTTKLVTLLKIKNSDYDAVVVPNYMLIGDVYHFQEEAAGRYRIHNRQGHYNIRAVRNTPGLHVEGIYPNEAYVNKEGIKVQDLAREKILFLKDKYFHASFLKKVKYEIGEKFPKDFYYPEVFFKDRPSIVSSPWQPITNHYRLIANIQTPLKKIKRRII